MKTKILLLAVFVLLAAALAFMPAATAAPFDRPGSGLLFPIFTTDSNNLAIQNTKIVLHNTHLTDSVTVRCVFIYSDGTQCMQNSVDYNLMPNTPKNIADISELIPNKPGYIICAAINPEDESLKAWDYLLGNAWFKTADGVTGSYAPTIYFANFQGTIPNEGKLKLGTDYIPGVPNQLYVSNSPSIVQGIDYPRLYAGSSINPDATPPADDIVAGSQAGVKNKLVLTTYNENELKFTGVTFSGNCWDTYSFSTVSQFQRASVRTNSFWTSINPTVSASSWGRLPTAVFANVNAQGLYNFVRGLHSSLATTNAYLPFYTTPPAQVCGNDLVEGTEQCDGEVCCIPAGQPNECTFSTGNVCRAAAGACDIAETCTGSNAYCPTDAYQNSDVICASSTDCAYTFCQNLCTLVGTYLPTAYCTGYSDTCPAQTPTDCSMTCDPGTSCRGIDSQNVAWIPSLSCAPTSETCNGIDDDCDVPAEIDEGIPTQTITCGIGACENTGYKACEGGTYVDHCTPLPPGIETNNCGDHIDNDCDGLYDCNDPNCEYDDLCGAACIDNDGDSYNGSNISAYCGDGICNSPYETYATCPSDCPVTCTDTDGGLNYIVKGKTCIDGDCLGDGCIVDGNIDLREYYCSGGSRLYQDIDCDVEFGPGWTCSNGVCIAPTCTETDLGIDYPVAGCTTASGTTKCDICTSNYMLTEYYCSGTTMLSTQYNCQNSDDPRTICRNNACGLPISSVSGAATFKPQATLACGTTDCNDNNPSIYPGATEVCNGVDDDCDIQIDETFPEQGTACDTGLPGACAIGEYICSSGSLSCSQTVFPITEICNNGIDDSCDGYTDCDDSACLTSPYCDTTPPVTTATYVGTMGNNNWYTSDVQVTLSCTDDISGCATTYYNINGGTFEIASTPFTVSSEGATTICYYSIDAAGNTETPAKCDTISVDKSVPTIVDATVTPDLVGQTATITITKTVTDNLAGVASVDAGVQDSSGGGVGKIPLTLISGDAYNGVWQGTFTFDSSTADGTYTIYDIAKDAAGNAAMYTDGSVLLDRTGPLVMITSITPNYVAPSGTVTIITEASDATSGFASQDSVIAKDGTAGIPATLTSFTGSLLPGETGTWTFSQTTALPEGNHTETVAATDKAGNSATASGIFIVDATAPTTTKTLIDSDNDGFADAFTLAATDALSGVNITYYSIDSGAYVAYTGQVTIPEGIHTINYYSVDNVGNTEIAKSQTDTGDYCPGVPGFTAPTEYVLEILDFASTASTVTTQRVFAGNTEVFASADGKYHIPLKDSSGNFIDDNTNYNTLPKGVWVVDRQGAVEATGIGTSCAGGGHDGHGGCYDNMKNAGVIVVGVKGDGLPSNTYVYYKTKATLDGDVVVRNTANAKFEKQGDGIAVKGNINQDEFTVATEGTNVMSILAEASVRPSSDYMKITFYDLQGCPYGDITNAVMHIVDQKKSGICGYGSNGRAKETCTVPIEGMDVKIYDRNDALFKSTYGSNPSKNLYDNIFEADIGLVGGCTTAADGACLAPEAYGGKFLVIGKYADTVNGITIYQGRLKNFKVKDCNRDEWGCEGSCKDEEEDDSDSVTLGENEIVKTKNLRIVKIINKYGSVKYEAGNRQIIIGSELNVVSADYVLWEENEELYPFVFSSTENWTVDVCVQVPEGYEIAGILDADGNVLATSDCVQAIIAGEDKVILFRVLETGSPEPNMSFTLTAEHEGQTTEIKQEVGGLRAVNEPALEAPVNAKVAEIQAKIAEEKQKAAAVILKKQQQAATGKLPAVFGAAGVQNTVVAAFILIGIAALFIYLERRKRQ